MEIRLKIGSSRSLKVIGTDIDRSATYDFLLHVVIHSNHGPISYHFRDKQRFRSKFVIFLSLACI